MEINYTDNNNNLNNSNIIKKRERVDKILVQKYPKFTRRLIQDLIRAGLVVYRGKTIARPSYAIDIDTEERYLTELEIRQSESNLRPLYVGRAGGKLRAGIEHFEVKVKGRSAADVGAGTGGFSDCLLEQGALRIYTIDVGHGQLAPKLLADPRILNYEGINLKYPFLLPEQVDLLVGDISFISLRKVVGTIFSLLHTQGEAILLFKPQFEVGREFLSKRGIVKSERLALTALHSFIDWFHHEGFPWKVVNHLPSPILGQEGNQEYLLHFKGIEIKA
ncbi:MAG: TlyA family RNA methyltransferase [Oligoflexia bacterium]|nr:TlyA family RNA methyltransferase [Oligoflexia bacterium]